MKTLAPWHPRRAVLSSILAGAVMLTGIAAPAAASASSAAPTLSPAPTSAPVPPGPDAKRHLDQTEATAKALAITQPTAVTGRGSAGIAPQADTVQIEGTVGDANGAPAEGVLVTIYSAQWDGATPYDYTLDIVQTVATDADGHYGIDVAPGYYKIFYDPVGHPNSAWQWDNGLAYPGAYPSTVDEFGLHANLYLDFAHDIGGALTGGPKNAPLTGATVALWAGEPRADGNIWFQRVWEVSSNAGKYDFPQMPQGFYLVEFPTADGRYAGEWWDDKPDFNSSDLFNLDIDYHATANASLGEYAQVLPALTVTGLAAVGRTVSVTLPAKVSGATYAYSWYADGVAIPGSSGKTSLALTSAQAGKQIQARVKVSKPGYVTVGQLTPKTTRVIANSAPTIVGPLAVGRTLTAAPNSWTSGTAFTYQWYVDGVAVPGATASTYVLTAAERDKTMKVGIKGSKSGYTTLSRGSTTSAKVAQIARPTIAGTPKVGQPLTAKPGVWTPGTTFGYQWYASGAAISGATTRSLKVVSTMVGKKITVRVTGSKTGYATFAQTSLPTTAVVK